MDSISIPGVYVGMADSLPLGPLMNKGLTIKRGQTHVQKYLRPLLERIQKSEIDPSFITSHTLSLDDAPKGYEMFKNDKDICTKVVLKPNGV